MYSASAELYDLIHFTFKDYAAEAVHIDLFVQGRAMTSSNFNQSVSRAEFSLEPLVAEPDRQAVHDGLVRYNAEHAYTGQRQPLNVLCRIEGRLVGGLLGEIGHGWLFISSLWVAGEHRRGGIGTALMQQAEEEARRQGCLGIYLDTFSFQAKPFYEGMGYRVFGELTGFLHDHTRYYLAKRF